MSFADTWVKRTIQTYQLQLEQRRQLLVTQRSEIGSSSGFFEALRQPLQRFALVWIRFHVHRLLQCNSSRLPPGRGWLKHAILYSKMWVIWRLIFRHD